MKWSSLFTVSFVAMLLSAGPASAAAGPTGPNAGVWPLGLGTLDGVVRRYPAAQANAAAVRLTSFAALIGIDFGPSARKPPAPVDEKILQYLEAQLSRGDDRIDALPPEVAEFLRSHEPQLNAIRELLIGWRVAWPVDLEHEERTSFPGIRAHTRLTRVLVVRALARSSWVDLRAAANLQRALSSRPELISQLFATSGTRLVLAAARKLPAPVPSWAGELTAIDVRAGVLGAVQVEAWRLRRELQEQDSSTSVRDRLEDIILKPFHEVVAGDYDDLLRRAATELAASRACAFDGPAFDRRLSSRMPFWDVITRNSTPNLGTIWQRVSRLTAERETTAIVLALKAGQTPPLRSSCSDGSWMFSRDASGAQHVRFSRSIPVRRPQLAIPLEYTVR